MDQENVDAPAIIVITFGELQNYQSSLPKCRCQNLRATISSLNPEVSITIETGSSYRILWVNVTHSLAVWVDAWGCWGEGTVSLPQWNKYFESEGWRVCPIVSKRVLEWDLQAVPIDRIFCEEAGACPLPLWVLGKRKTETRDRMCRRAEQPSICTLNQDSQACSQTGHSPSPSDICQINNKSLRITDLIH